MKKKVISLIMSAGILLSGCSAGNTKEPQETAVTSLCENEAALIVNTLEILEDMQQIKNRVIQGSLFSGDEIYTDACVYMSTQDKADTVGVFIVTDLELAMSDLQEYVSMLATKTNQYDATEMFKIANAVLENNGSDKIVLIIASDIEAAKKVTAKLLS